MKLVCLKCEKHLLYERQEDLDVCLGITFACPQCGYRLAMVTNPGETQLVHSMGIKIGGRSSEHTPLELTRTALDEGEEAEITWTEEAEKRLENIPPFVRPMAIKGIERLAREKGYKKITAEVMDEARERFMR